VGWWRAEDNGADSAGENHGSRLQDLAFAPGRVGQAFSFNRANQELLIPPSRSIDVGALAGLTIEAWINPADAINQYPLAEWGDGFSLGTHFWINVSFGGVGGPGALYASPGVGDSSYFASPPGIISAGAWQHVAFTYDKVSGTARLYHNGVQVAAKAAGPFNPPTGLPLNLGRRIGGDTYRGLLDEASLYSRALGSNEIRTIYLAGANGKCEPICGNGGSMTQDFEVGTPINYTASQHGTAPGPLVQNAGAGSTGRFLRLINDGANSQNNSVSFAQVPPGMVPRVIRAEFDFRLNSGDAPADGLAFMLIPTSNYGTNGHGFVTPIAFEEPNIPGVFAVGFDVHPRTEPRNDVSVHWNGAEVINVTLPDAALSLTAGVFHRAVVVLTHVPDGALVTVNLLRDVNSGVSAICTPIREVFVPGLEPFSSRAEIAARSGALDMNVDIDNVRVDYAPPCLTAR